MAKSEKRLMARNLRTEGQSIKSIAKALEVSVGSVSLWCRDITLNVEQIERLSQNAKDPQYGKRLQNSIKQKNIRIEKIEHLMKAGREEVGTITVRELFVAGIALYWAEGYKKDSMVGFGNSDPKMILFFVKWLRQCFGYTNNDLIFRVTVNKSHEYRIDEIQDYWSKLVKINYSEFRKPFFQNVKWQKIYDNPQEYFGVLRVRVRNSTDFLRKIHGYIQGLRENI